MSGTHRLLFKPFFHGSIKKKLVEEKYGDFNVETIIRYIYDSYEWVLAHKEETLSSMAKNFKNYSYNNQFMWYLICNSLQWFDNELQYYFDIDVYSEPFRSDGWALVDHRFLVLKFENLGEKLDQVIGNFIQRPNFKMIRTNTAEEKDYAEIYKEVRSEIKFNQECLDFVYGTKYAKHFYSDLEIDGFYKRWGK